MYSSEKDLTKALSLCEKEYGVVDYTFGPLKVSEFTDYYKNEMGNELKKVYMSFEKLIERDRLAGIKNHTNSIESGFLNNKNRSINLDPGYLTNEKLVLATTKDYFHRIYLENGIYAEVTLHYRHGKFRYFSWSYPDYKDARVQIFLEKARAKLVGELRRLDRA